MSAARQGRPQVAAAPAAEPWLTRLRRRLRRPAAEELPVYEVPPGRHRAGPDRPSWSRIVDHSDDQARVFPLPFAAWLDDERAS
jgi:hypothetical protein